MLALVGYGGRPFCLTRAAGWSILSKSPVTCPKRMLVQSIKSILVYVALLTYSADAQAATMNWSAVFGHGQQSDGQLRIHPQGILLEPRAVVDTWPCPAARDCGNANDPYAFLLRSSG